MTAFISIVKLVAKNRQLLWIAIAPSLYQYAWHTFKVKIRLVGLEIFHDELYVKGVLQNISGMVVHSVVCFVILMPS